MPDAPSEFTISRLARDVARNLIPLDQILKSSQISPSQYEQVVAHPFFRSRLEEELNAWNGDVRTRVQAKAATLIEESLDEIFLLVHDRAVPLNHKIDALKFAARLAAMEDGAKEGPGDRVVININLGDDRKLTFDKEVLPEPKTIEGVVEVVS